MPGGDKGKKRVVRTQVTLVPQFRVNDMWHQLCCYTTLRMTWCQCKHR
jgi:hypothetical protein